MSALTAWLAKPIVKYGALALAILAIAAGTIYVLNREYSRGEETGKSAVTEEVQKTTIQAQESAVIQKEKAHEEVLSTPYSDLTDGLR